MKVPKRRKRPHALRPRWCVVSGGWILYMFSVRDDGTPRTVVPLFSDRITAVRFIDAQLSRMHGGSRRMRAAEIGTVQGETLDRILAEARADGVDAAVWVQTVGGESYTMREMPLMVAGDGGSSTEAMA